MIMPIIMWLMSPGEPATSTDVATVADASGHLASDDRLRPLVAAWLLSFKSPHTVRSYRNDLVHWLAFAPTTAWTR